MRVILQALYNYWSLSVRFMFFNDSISATNY